MLNSEFTAMTGFIPTDDYYHGVIEPEYEKSSLLKEEWCRKWLNGGGVQKAYDALKADLEELDKVHSKMEEEFALTLTRITQERDEKDAAMDEMRLQLRDKLEETNEAQKNTIVKLAHFMLEQSCKCSPSDIRNMALDILGDRDYLRYKLEHGLPLYERDNEIILNILNEPCQQ